MLCQKDDSERYGRNDADQGEEPQNRCAPALMAYSQKRIRTVNLPDDIQIHHRQTVDDRQDDRD